MDTFKYRKAASEAIPKPLEGFVGSIHAHRPPDLTLAEFSQTRGIWDTPPPPLIADPRIWGSRLQRGIDSRLKMLEYTYKDHDYMRASISKSSPHETQGGFTKDESLPLKPWGPSALNRGRQGGSGVFKKPTGLRISTFKTQFDERADLLKLSDLSHVPKWREEESLPKSTTRNKSQQTAATHVPAEAPTDLYISLSEDTSVGHDLQRDANMRSEKEDEWYLREAAPSPESRAVTASSSQVTFPQSTSCSLSMGIESRQLNADGYTIACCRGSNMLFSSLDTIVDHGGPSFDLDSIQGYRNNFAGNSSRAMERFRIASLDKYSNDTMSDLSLTPPGTSDGYRGNVQLRMNYSADISPELSTSLWITNIPPDCTHRSLLAAVRNCGKIYACVISPPEPAKGHSTAAAKLVFFYLAGANALLRQAQLGLFTVGGYVPRVIRNRIRTEAQSAGTESRVLHIEGPKVLVNQDFLTRWFAARFVYEVEEVLVLSEDEDPNGNRRLEWRFASYRCQAAAAVTFIDRARRSAPVHPLSLWRRVNTYYGVDPCI